MKFRALSARAGAALALLACGGDPAATAAAEASTPSLLWADARHLAVNCLVQSATIAVAQSLASGLCSRVRELAARGAPFPVKQVQPGDAALIASDTVTLLVHASVERTAHGQTLVFTIRPMRASDGETNILFGTPPRTVEFPAGRFTPAVDSALSEALAEILPWQRPAGLVARPL